MKDPLVTVLMPFQNAVAYIDAAIDSILGQTEPSFVLMAIDDGSTDGSVDRVLTRSDARIQLVADGKKLGLIHRLNWGLDHATSAYVARMDADDISAPDRLAKQVRFMRAHPDIGVCGSWYRAFDDETTLWEARMPEEHDNLAAMTLFGSPMAHGSVMLNMTIFNQFGLRYSPHAAHAEDYELWERASTVTRLGNVPEILYEYRVHQQQVSALFRMEQCRQADAVRARALMRLGVEYSDQQLRTHCRCAAGTASLNFRELYLGMRWMRHLRKTLLRSGKGNGAVIQACRKEEKELVRKLRRQLGRLLRRGKGLISE